MIFRRCGTRDPYVRRRGWRPGATIAVASAGICMLLGGGLAVPAAADSFYPINGAGSTWSFNALDAWRKDVTQYGIKVNYAGTGSSDGRTQFLHGTVDFAASDIPFQPHPEDGSAPENPAPGSYAYMPVTAGGTAFVYNLTINGQRVTNLRLSGVNLTKIFTGAITTWNDPAIVADNPGLTMPGQKIVPVVRSDGSGSSAQFTTWMVSQHPDLWNTYCHTSGRAPACGFTSFYPTIGGMISAAGDLGVIGYVTQGYGAGSIGYVNYSYALNANFPVAKILNAAGYYTEPTPQNVAVSLLQAQVDTADVNDPTKYLTQKLDGVYGDTDPRTYALSSYSYLIMPTVVPQQGSFTSAKGHTLAAFAYYAMCQGQQESASLGYSPMPQNLVQAGFDQIKKVPGAVVENINLASCNNPTFSSTGANLLAQSAPQPQACDKQGPAQCATGTGNTKPTPTKNAGATGTGTGTGATAGRTATAGAGSTASGGTGTGTATTVAGGVVDPNAATACDPNNGGCPAAAIGGNQQTASAVALTLPAPKGWSSTQTLMLLAAALTLCLIFAPGIAAAIMKRRQNG